MLITLIVAAVWILAGVGVFLFAMNRGRKPKHGPAPPASRRRLAIGLGVLYLGVGLAIPVAAIAGSTDDDTVKSSGIVLTAQQKNGQELFGALCASCHRLKSADAVGRTGPNLDMQLAAQPAADPAAAKRNYDGRVAYVYGTIINGIQRGNGTMPALLAQGQRAKEIAAFVAATAGYGNP